MILLDMVTFLGRMHPLIIHLPIGFLLLAIIFDAVSYHRKYYYLNQSVPFTLLAGFISASAACGLGYLLSLSGDYEEQTLNNHMLSGLILTVMAGLLYALTTVRLKRIVNVPRPLLSALSMVTFFLLLYTGHHGATLTHGTDFLTLETLRRQNRERPTDVREAMIFEDLVHPILEERCIQCHRRDKKKGRLSLESVSSMLQGGKHGPAIVPGDVEESELFKRITLDPSHENFMPADGKPPLTETERELLRWWIEEAMAVKGKKISELEGGEKIILHAASVLGLQDESDQERYLSEAQVVNRSLPDSVDASQLKDLRKHGFVVRVMLRKPLMLDITLPPGSGKRMAEVVNYLKPVAANVVWLNLSDNGFAAEDLGILRQMANLEKLRLEKNPVSDDISRHLANLGRLEAVNLNETKLTSAGLEKLQENKAIKRIYTWKTMCDTSYLKSAAQLH
jgi:uncharacterized membrane protein